MVPISINVCDADHHLGILRQADAVFQYVHSTGSRNALLFDRLLQQAGLSAVRVSFCWRKIFRVQTFAASLATASPGCLVAQLLV